MYFLKVNEEGKVVVDDLRITDKGVPMATFMKIVNNMNDLEDDLDNVIEEIYAQND